MSEYIIKWDAGCGEEYDIVEAEDEKVATRMAYEIWNEEIQSNASFSTVGKATKKLKKELGL